MESTSSTKQVALELIQRLPDDVTLEDIMYELYFRQAIDQGLKEAEEGKVVPHSQVMQEALEWLKSTIPSARA
jgi:hypothetical protein